MSARNDIAPSTLGVELAEEGVYVEYTDGREAFYNGVPEPIEGTLHTNPGKDVHVLVTDPTETEGVLVYVNDLKTHDEILESTGVGRLLLDPGEREELFPGVTVQADGYAIDIDADPETARGRVFVFAEDELSEYAYEIVGPA
ncbi:MULTISPECIES: DUF5796 family protein [Halobacterium]|uniref:Uncharacterized protein n=4 Tax=Halobacterium salinarum TaxID=2242 RepID=Q9HQA9_HALSA|nr:MULTISPECIES: DUF5796 family protein [Halobacterium]AAG19606.1 hypothetical protein VNG_1246H [Halobacterium salinarum NRC-1]MBB6090295.1 hypothetical protein [Halobacterium salinarum]MCF2165115.1 hypothetical protein [Halobacterium salinarum]MCF2168076.1 hypothetical protein [Halobacterium salinarum]MCF2208546.1 hypothetical protein [Halobacterium salinarum]